MPGVDPSDLNNRLLVESWYVDLQDYIIDLAWSPDASKLAAVSVEGGVFLIDDFGDSAFFKQMGQHSLGANSISWRCDGAQIASGGQDGLVKVWDGASGQEIWEMEAGNSWVSKTLFSPRRKVLATAAGKHLKLWNDEYDAIYESSDHASTIADIGWNPTGPGIAAVANLGLTLHLTKANDRPKKIQWKGSSLALRWSPEGKFIATGEQDATVHYYFVGSNRDVEIRGYSTKVQHMSWDVSGRWLATGGGPAAVVWDCSGAGPMGRQPIQLEIRSSKLTQLAFQPDGNLLATSDADGFLFLWEPDRHDEIIGGVQLAAPASCLRWVNGDRLAAGQEDGKVVVFQIRSAAGSRN
ncbi:MAG: WD40 repeat domain-containing protein [Planctomycetota bacterium]